MSDFTDGISDNISMLILGSIASKRRGGNFENIVRELTKEKGIILPPEPCGTLEELKEKLSQNSYDVILIHVAPNEDKLWQHTLDEIKSRNKFSEVIVVIRDERNQPTHKARKVLNSGAFAYFEYPFQNDVLFGYIRMAKLRCIERHLRTNLSAEMNNNETDIKKIAEKIAGQLKKLTTYKKDIDELDPDRITTLIPDGITITLLNRRLEQYGSGYYRTMLYSSYREAYKDEYGEYDEEKFIFWYLKRFEDENKLVDEIIDDENKLVDKIVASDIAKRIFPTIDKEVKSGFLKTTATPKLNSLIVLPLRHAEKLVGLITIDGYEKNQFDISIVNEVTLEQVANQAAVVLKNAERLGALTKLREALHALNNSASLDDVLENLSMHTCQLVGGLFSYIVQPDIAKTHLAFKAAWSQDHKRVDFLTLLDQIRFDDHQTGESKPGFSLIDPKDNILRREGLTTLAYKNKPYTNQTGSVRIVPGNVRIVEHIGDKSYDEPDKEAQQNYYEFIYMYGDKQLSKKKKTETDIAVPIIDGEEVLGVINVEHEHPFAFTEEHIETLQQLAKFTAIAIRNHSAQKRVDQLSKLSDFPYSTSPQSSVEDELRKIFDPIADGIREESGAEFVTIFSVKDNTSFYIGISDHSAPEFIKAGARRGLDPNKEGQTFWSIRNKEPVVIGDTEAYRNNPSWQDMYKHMYQAGGDAKTKQEGVPNIPINPKTGHDIKALVCLPMLLNEDHENKAVGAIWMHYKHIRTFSEQEITDFLRFAHMAAIALRNQENVLFSAIEAKIGARQERKAVLAEIVDFSKKYSELSGVAIYEADVENRQLTCVKSTIDGFEGETLKFGQDGGLAGNLIVGDDLGEYHYSQGYWAVPDQAKYVHRIKQYTTRKHRQLNSLLGIRMPPDGDSQDAVGVLILNARRGYTYEESYYKFFEFLEFARIAAEHIALTKPTKDEIVKAPEKSTLLEQEIEKDKRNLNRNRLIEATIIGVGACLALLGFKSTVPIGLIDVIDQIMRYFNEIAVGIATVIGFAFFMILRSMATIGQWQWLAENPYNLGLIFGISVFIPTCFLLILLPEQWDKITTIAALLLIFTAILGVVKRSR